MIMRLVLILSVISNFLQLTHADPGSTIDFKNLKKGNTKPKGIYDYAEKIQCDTSFTKVEPPMGPDGQYNWCKKIPFQHYLCLNVIYLCQSSKY